MSNINNLIKNNKGFIVIDDNNNRQLYENILKEAILNQRKNDMHQVNFNIPLISESLDLFNSSENIENIIEIVSDFVYISSDEVNWSENEKLLLHSILTMLIPLKEQKDLRNESGVLIKKITFDDIMYNMDLETLYDLIIEVKIRNNQLPFKNTDHRLTLNHEFINVDVAEKYFKFLNIYTRLCTKGFINIKFNNKIHLEILKNCQKAFDIIKANYGQISGQSTENINRQCNCLFIL